MLLIILFSESEKYNHYWHSIIELGCFPEQGARVMSFLGSCPDGFKE